ncbi:MAG: hypothetical protein EOO82_02635, partial [Oxalobacteraceae bacterium]
MSALWPDAFTIRQGAHSSQERAMILDSLRNMRIARRLGLGFGLCLVLLCISAAVSSASMGAINRSLHLITEDRYVKVQHVGDLREEVNFQARAVRNLLIFIKPDDRQAEMSALDASRAKTGPLIEKLDAMIEPSSPGQQKLDAIRGKRESFGTELTEVVRLVRADQLDQARDYVLTRMRNSQLDYMKHLDDLSSYQESLMKTSADEADALVVRSRVEVAGLTA